MADNTKFVQGVDYKLSGSGIGLTDTNVTLQSFKQPDGSTDITMTDFGAIGYAVLAPGTSKEENISFTGVTQNPSGTATLTGVTRGLRFVDPYTQDTNLRKSHAGGTILRISNTSPFYSEFALKDNNETITEQWTFPTGGSAQAAIVGSSYSAPTVDNEIATKKYIDDIAISGAPDASTTVKGLVEIATFNEAFNGISTGGTGAVLVVNPADLLGLRSQVVSVAFTYGDTIVAGDVLYLDTADAKWKKADGSVAGTADNTYGIALDPGVDTDTGKKVLVAGVASTVTGISTAGIQYVSDTAGSVSNTTGTYKKVVGFSPDGVNMILNFVPRIEELAGSNTNVTTTNMNNLFDDYVSGALEDELAKDFTATKEIKDGDIVASSGNSTVDPTFGRVGTGSDAVAFQSYGGSSDTGEDHQMLRFDYTRYIYQYRDTNSNGVEAYGVGWNPQTETFTNAAAIRGRAASSSQPDFDILDESSNLVISVYFQSPNIESTVDTIGGNGLWTLGPINTIGAGSDCKVTALTTTKLLISYRVTSPSNAMRFQLATVSGATVTAGNFVDVLNVNTHWRNWDIMRIDNDHAIATWAETVSGSTRQDRYVVIDGTAATPVAGTPINGSSTYSNSQGRTQELGKLGATNNYICGGEKIRALSVDTTTDAVTELAEITNPDYTGSSWFYSSVETWGDRFFSVTQGEQGVGTQNRVRTFYFDGTSTITDVDGSPVNLRSSTFAQPIVRAFSPYRCISCTWDVSGSSYRRWFQDKIFNTNYDIVSGLAKQDIATSATDSILLYGVNDNVPNVVSATNYYISYNGAVYENISGINEKEENLLRIGTGIDTNTLLIKY